MRLTSRVVTSVFLSGEALDEDVADRLSILFTMSPDVHVSSSCSSNVQLERRVTGG